MAVTAQNGVELVIDPQNVRYSLTVDRLAGFTRQTVELQRSMKKEDGSWIDDPLPTSKKSIPLPVSCQAAVDGVVALVPTILGKLNVTGDFTDLRLRLISTLSATGVLDVRATIQIKQATRWIAKMIPSLNTFLASNMDIAVAVGTAWAGVDVALTAANAAERWV